MAFPDTPQYLFEYECSQVFAAIDLQHFRQLKHLGVDNYLLA